MATIGERLYERMKNELGNGEVGGNNAGPHVARYKRRERWEYGQNLGAWCASLVSYCLEEVLGGPVQAAAYVDVPLKVWNRRRHGARWLFRRLAAVAATVSLEDARPGDVVLFPRGRLWQRHIGVFSSASRLDDYLNIFYCVEGNVGRNAKVRWVPHHAGDELGIVRLV